MLRAMIWGLNSAFINPASHGLIANVRAMDILVVRNPLRQRYRKHWHST